MATEAKRYYWLKLTDDFFKQKEIKKLRSIAGGDTFTIIYLKMLLRSMKDGGKLYYEGIENDFASELALDIDEDEDNVSVTVNFLLAKGILHQNTASEYEVVTTKEMTGSECDSARRVRQMRNRRALELPASNGDIALHCNGDVTASNDDVIQGNTDIRDKSIDIIKEDNARARACEEEVNPYGDSAYRPQTNTVQQYAINSFTVLGVRAMEELNSFVDDLGEEIVRHAIDNTLDKGVTNWGYCKSILNGYVQAGVKTLAQAKAHDEKFRESKGKNARGGKQEPQKQQQEKAWEDMTAEERENALKHGPFGRFY